MQSRRNENIEQKLKTKIYWRYEIFFKIDCVFIEGEGSEDSFLSNHPCYYIREDSLITRNAFNQLTIPTKENMNSFH